ncbi:adenylate cyclase [Candidatus Magnetomoraceae bacterium gMMP-15]
MTAIKQNKRQYTPFRTKLIYFAALLMGLISVIVIPLELYRPIGELIQLIEKAKNLVGGSEASFNISELTKMNRFALNSIVNFDCNVYDKRDRIYYAVSFNMILMEGDILSENEVKNKLIDFEEKFEYNKLLTASYYWKTRFSADPGIFDIFKKYKFILMEVKKNALAAGFELSDFMIMIDTGKKEGFFEHNIAYVLNSSPWYEEPVYSGEPYEITSDNEFWRKSALIGEEGYGNNPVSSSQNWYMPHFDVDEWGSWFSVWITKKNHDIYNIFSIDFNAKSVKKLMLVVASFVASVIFILTIIVIFVVRGLSERVTRPITELSKGAEEVANGNYNYVVPTLKEDEFGELTRQFNKMTHGQKQRFNLMETLQKFLSKELAEMVAESGLTKLIGKQAEATIMFTDFAGFSTITQKMKAQDIVKTLNFYFNELIGILKKYGGFPDKYIGDAIVAFFGAPVPMNDHAERAVACAIEMQWKMREINEKRRKEGKTVFEMRIGLNSGEVIAGAIGCDMKLEYTSIGETTNLANRMESICKIGHVMMAEGTYSLIKDIFFKGVNISALPQREQVKGYSNPVATYGVYVTDLWIEKNKDAKNPIKNFYTYKHINRNLKYRSQDVENLLFNLESKFLKTVKEPDEIMESTSESKFLKKEKLIV